MRKYVGHNCHNFILCKLQWCHFAFAFVFCLFWFKWPKLHHEWITLPRCTSFPKFYDFVNCQIRAFKLDLGMVSVSVSASVFEFVFIELTQFFDASALFLSLLLSLMWHWKVNKMDLRKNGMKKMRIGCIESWTYFSSFCDPFDAIFHLYCLFGSSHSNAMEKSKI